MVYFYWTNRRDAICTNSLQKEQIVNHFAKAGSFTTKVDLQHVFSFCSLSLEYVIFVLFPPLPFTLTFITSLFTPTGGVVCELKETPLV